jgi:hypothetical protein
MQLLQRNGFEELIDEAKVDARAEIYHMDGKSKYFYPKFFHEPRGIPHDRYMVHAIGNFLTS